MVITIVSMVDAPSSDWDASSSANARANLALVIGLGLPCRLAGMVIICLIGVLSTFRGLGVSSSSLGYLLALFFRFLYMKEVNAELVYRRIKKCKGNN